MSDIYELTIDWRSAFTNEEFDLLCNTYNLSPSIGKVEEESGNFTVGYLTVKDDPINFKKLFSKVNVIIGKVVETTQALEILHTLRRIEERLNVLEVKSPVGLPNKPVYESDGITRFAMPEWFIAHIKKVEVRIDSCTDSIQQDLDNGWHILAICPQAGQRRPDYILGRL
jgi:hypothetical protein